MHEYPITLEIIRLAEQAARNNGADRVELVSLVIGDLSGYVGDSVRMYFDVISKGTMCEGSTLDIKRIETKLRCASCGELFKRKPYSFDCPFCGGEGRPTDIGKEFYIDYIEVKKTGENNGN